MTFGNVNVFNQQFNPISFWQFPNGNGLPYLDLSLPSACIGRRKPFFVAAARLRLRG
jgi:hypothetical protein